MSDSSKKKKKRRHNVELEFSGSMVQGVSEIICKIFVFMCVHLLGERENSYRFLNGCMTQESKKIQHCSKYLKQKDADNVLLNG